jgi:hypothetical protein
MVEYTKIYTYVNAYLIGVLYSQYYPRNNHFSAGAGSEPEVVGGTSANCDNSLL